ncbi:triose phosphate/3-phosphoglycerate/phosphate translocator [Cutaneotrichosporon oleaginosum]|uniref:Triose phosphate/3-phosphoglycerate/phosphate translocator n=1 Tax=Cutaneotrichosporon oleaginosum TaxID=879819 RepID=A0A0J0XQF3_9TREE|nr:triose phosphate/3-phosphoglycerate/phosphate translocator [Cutaneotrichosporon oleaginosum]KLT43351.1 triose phosphate/3-phosphoglycerate/phosphate translocator [Cutaneotrichosporon oleaginosum]
MPSPSPPLLPTHSPHGSPVDERHSPIHNLLKSTPRGSPAYGEKHGKHMPLSGKEKDDDYITTKPTGKVNLRAATIIPIWIALSSTVIIYNKYLYSVEHLNFPYPIFITSYHLGCAALGTRVLRATTNLMDGLDKVPMTRDVYIKRIIPIGILFSGSLILSNSAYLTLSVSFIQMLKAFTPVAIVLISAVFKIQALNTKLLAIVVLISVGCALSAYGELHFELLGFLFQTSAVVFESSRLVMIQVLLQGLKMDPLVSLHYYAPVCSIINACFLPFTEGLAPFRELPRIGLFIMSTNALAAFGLNVAAVFLISAAGGLTLTLAGVFKDILLITASVVFFGSPVTLVQVFGYSLALSGLFIYKNAAGKK